METRTVLQYQVYYLILNPMKYQIEAQQCVAIADERQKLIDWYNNLKADPYIENTEINGGRSCREFRKYFKKGSPLEWFNPCPDTFEPSAFGHGIISVWVTEEMLEVLKNTNYCLF